MSLLTFRKTLMVTGLAFGLLVSSPAHAEETTVVDAVRVERNSLPMMITGISLLALGFVATGVGTGAWVAGRVQCHDDVAPGTCKDGRIATTGGIAAIIGGSTLSMIGLGLTIAGAWKITIPQMHQTSRLSLSVGAGTAAIMGSF